MVALEGYNDYEAAIELCHLSLVTHHWPMLQGCSDL